jgi:hypothetical protein
MHVKYAKFGSKRVVWTTANLGLQVGDREFAHLGDPDRMAVVFDHACEVLGSSVGGVGVVFVGQRGNVGLVDVGVQVPEHTIITSQCPTDT